MLNALIHHYLKRRYKRLEGTWKYPMTYQKAIFNTILDLGSKTTYGRNTGMHLVQNIDDYRTRIPLCTYEDLKPYIDKMIRGESNILYPGRISWFARSAGTTAGKSKYIPVSPRYLRRGHIKSGWDSTAIIYNEDPGSNLFAQKNLIMGGSISSLNDTARCGDISAIIINSFPTIGRPFFTPDRKTALLGDWDEKIVKMAHICAKQDVTLVAGVPTWTIVLFDKILEHTGKDNILEVWPGLKTYLHGGVGFDPYRDLFNEYLPSDSIVYREVYNASEGYFAIQNNSSRDGMALQVDHDIFYEFITVEDYHAQRFETLLLDEVEPDREYVMVISNTSGLYRYILGDTVRFAQKYPFTIKVTGRTKQYINTFGEEVVVGNTDKALEMTCSAMDCHVVDYTVAPVYMRENGRGGHEWLIEFNKIPHSLPQFEEALDLNLRMLNSDYEAKRYNDMALENLIVRPVDPGTFERWLRQNGKIGGQNKVPRLSNGRSIIEDILKLSKHVSVVNQ